MCTVSMIGDHYRDKWEPRPWFPGISPMMPGVPITPSMPYQPMAPSVGAIPMPPISRAEFDALKKEVEEMKALLKRAKEYDERNGEPNCEMDEKMAVLRKVAKLVGVDLDDVIGK